MSNNYILLSNGGFVSTDELYHHGIKGQKWGVRRYQNEDGTLTELGKKRQQQSIESDRETTIVKGTKFYRVSDSDTDDTSSGKIYVSASKETGDYYLEKLGSTKIYKTGKAYVHEYIANTDLKLPDKKTMEKIELGLLNNKDVQTELIDSLMKKGVSREEATARVRPYSAGKAFVEKASAMTMTGLYGGLAGGNLGLVATGFNPIGAAVGAGAGAAIAAGTIAKTQSSERIRALNTARVSYGDKNNKAINDALVTELQKRGYNAMKDYNDRRAFGDNGKQAIMVFDSNKNLTNSRISEVKSNDYGRAYAKNYLKEHPNSKLSFNDLVKDGEAKYKKLYEDGLVAREQEKERQRILDNATKNT